MWQPRFVVIEQSKDLVCGIDTQSSLVPVIIRAMEMEISGDRFNGVFPFLPRPFPGTELRGSGKASRLTNVRDKGTGAEWMDKSL